jgi:hypothetical protein
MPIMKLFMTISDYKLFIPIQQEAFLEYWFMLIYKFRCMSTLLEKLKLEFVKE